MTLARVSALVALALAGAACQQQVLGRFQTPPIAAITTPDDGAVITGISAPFAGAVEDGQDAGPAITVVWRSSLAEEPLLSGTADASGFTTFTATSLPPGPQVITLTATDSDGMLAEDSIEIDVRPGAPLVDILEPTAGAVVDAGTLIQLRGTVSSDVIGGLTYAWFSNQQGVDTLLGAGDLDPSGETSLATALPAGLHVVRLEAYDVFDQLGADDVLIQVQPAQVDPVDLDHDGWCPGGQDLNGDGSCDESELGPLGDCDDTNAQIHPGAPEICDGIDDDCDFVLPADERDNDADSWSPCEGDCDDLRSDVHPAHAELCDGVDNDCDSLVDENDQDVDGDGWTGCDGDCNDNNAAIYPAAPEICDGVDNNCDGNVDENSTDTDGDGVAVCAGDCNDNNPTVYPNAPEQCDGLDNDCDGAVDENNVDGDGDGVTGCDGDCNDSNGAMFPGNPEVCDLLDNNCNGQIDEHDVDADFDGVRICQGDCDDSNGQRYPGNAEVCDGIDNDCDNQVDENGGNADGDPVGVCGGDCNDNNPTIYPGAPELCDGLDNDCNFQVPANEYDTDGDGVRVCQGDCNDSNPVMAPGRPEVCDAYDNDCSGIVNDPWDPTELGESSSTAFGEATSLPGFNHIVHLPWAPCSGATCQVFGGAITLCRNNISVNGAFASQADSFDAFYLDYDNLATTLGCEMTVSLFNIPSGHDYSLRLYRTSNINAPVSSWDLLQSSDRPGNQSEYLTQPATNFLDFGSDTFVLVVQSKGNWNCPTAGNYTLNVTGG